MQKYRRWLVTLVGLGLLGLGARAGAQVNCDRKLNDFDAVYCDIKVFAQADNDLTTAYTKLRARLNPAAQVKLRDLQRAWIAQRNSACVGHDEKGPLVYTDCAVQMTTERTNFLNDRLRECATSGCRVSALR